MHRRGSASPSQPTLGGLAEASPSDRLFFAVFPDAAAAARIAALAASLRAAHGLHGRPVRADRLHVTLFHLGDYHGLPMDLVDEATQAAGKVAMSPFETGFDSASSFAGRPRNRPFVLRGDEAGTAGIAGLHAALGERLKATRLAQWARPGFVPHVTLLYDERTVESQPIEPVAWTVREFVLVHSLIGRTEHRPLARWPLQGGSA
ncbi:MAG TPA: 2'-5' RNA ligase family protein [Luteimonas sp.]|nr:2'-5' RNA ligase family protein [Luteimonas sp.]